MQVRSADSVNFGMRYVSILDLETAKNFCEVANNKKCPAVLAHLVEVSKDIAKVYLFTGKKDIDEFKILSGTLDDCLALKQGEAAALRAFQNFMESCKSIWFIKARWINFWVGMRSK